MLLNIHIKNIALIDEIDIDFSDNLNILTGETGAGKSILIDSIMLALGGKSPKDFVRNDAEYGLVELLFSIEQEDIKDKLIEMEIPDVDSGELILSRKIVDGRSVCKANGSNVTMGKLKEIAGLLLDLHAQHENQSLLKQSNHLKLLDRYGHESIDGEKQRVAELFSKYDKIKKELDSNNINEEEKKRKLDLIAFEKKEIEEAALKPSEDEELEESYKRALHGRNITESLSLVNNLLENNASEYIDRAIRELNDASSYDAFIASMTESAATAADILSEVSKNARDYLENNTFSEEEFRSLEDRLNEINHLKAKYGRTIEDILKYHDELEIEYDKLLNREEYLSNLEKELSDISVELEDACAVLSKKRQEMAKVLTANIIESLKDLNFLDVRFDMVFERQKEYSAEGYDKAFFIISTNIGEEEKPLEQVASGGEISRIMLALKSNLADVDEIPTLVFDEIDVGISGKTAAMVAEKISAIGRKRQVICITHLPQIAAYADHHYLIEKNVIGSKTVTNIRKLNKEEEISELARLVGGTQITQAVINNAKEMKELAAKGKVN